MGFEISPAVERAEQLAKQLAAGRELRLSDWIRSLLQEDDGKPAHLLIQAGQNPSILLEQLSETLPVDPVAPMPEELYELAQDRGIALRADPTLTTDLLLLILLESSPELCNVLGLSASSLARCLRTPTIDWDQPEATFSGQESPTPSCFGDLSNGFDQQSAARIVDANLNRVREALRVLEDYCRFVLNQPASTEQLKLLRHRLAAAVEMLPQQLLLRARDTLSDVGTTIGIATEYDRSTPSDVVTANCKRIQEALRSAEEYGKLLDPRFSQHLEQLRYDTYRLESVLTVAHDARDRLARARLYLLITVDQCRLGLERTTREAIAGGVGIVQLREKTLPDRQLLAHAKTLRKITQDSNVLLIINDRPDIARLVDADGVHVGQDDLPVAEARRIAGPQALIGVSTHTLLQVRQACAEGADYIGIGPTFPSRTKSFESFPGLPFIRAAVAITTVPTFALGGIDSSTIADVVEAGATRVAVSSAILMSDEPRKTARELDLALCQNVPLV